MNYRMNVKLFEKINFLCAVFCILFSLTTLSFHADVSVVAFPFSVLFSLVYFLCSFRKLFEEKNLRFIPVVRLLLQYMPYVLLISFVLRRAGAEGTSSVLDVLSVFLWVLSSAAVVFILHFMNPKNIHFVSEEWKVFVENAKKASKSEKKNPVLKFLFEVISWIDALVQAIFLVLLLNIFIVQLYEIPSESMVPEFLIRDRVVVFKTLSGPKFPLSNVGIPYLKKYDRGDIVVFRNPHYASDRKSEVRTFISQLVYMCTLTKVNINVESNGELKADPLVKRVVGVPGEQLMMQDGILYSRTAKDKGFVPVEDDSKWAAWNLNEVKPSLKSGIELIPLSKANYEKMIECEELRRNFDVESAKSECTDIASDFRKYFASLKIERNGTFNFAEDKFDEYNLFTQSQNIALKLIASTDGDVWFKNFMTDWISHVPDFAGDLYAEANYKLNLMIKLTVGKLVLRDMQLMAQKIPAAEWKKDGEINKSLEMAQMLHFYIYILDMRNMPVFPKNDADGKPVFIPENNYFMMGDNRFNSLDMRHSYESKLVKISEYDAYSAKYNSDMAPQYVDRKKILGNTSYRFWPVSRAGKPGLTGKN